MGSGMAWLLDLLKRHFRKAAQLAAVQLGGAALAQDLDGAHADAQVLVDALAVEVVGHAGQLDLAVQRLVAHSQPGPEAHTKKETNNNYY